MCSQRVVDKNVLVHAPELLEQSHDIRGSLVIMYLGYARPKFPLCINVCLQRKKGWGRHVKC